MIYLTSVSHVAVNIFTSSLAALLLHQNSDYFSNGEQDSFAELDSSQTRKRSPRAKWLHEYRYIQIGDFQHLSSSLFESYA